MSDRPNGAGRQRRLHHAQIHLPPLSADYALTLVGIFERAIEAVWRAHGEAMGRICELRHQHARAETDGLVTGNGRPESVEEEDS
jgi:hypothetical protein